MTMRLLLLPLVLAACHSAPAATPTNVVERFYAASIASGASGAPSAEDLAALSPFLSDSLKALLVAARRLYEAARVPAPDDKPPFADGSLFSSLFEGPTTVSVIGDTARGATHAVTVRMTYSGATPLVSWTDVVLVVQEHGRFVIEDIEYGGNWDFANKGTLRSSLASATERVTARWTAVAPGRNTGWSTLREEQQGSPSRVTEREAVVMTLATGTFEVKVLPLAADDSVDTGGFSRLSLDKRFSGNLQGTSRGQMVAANTAVEGSAAYVALERVSGTLQGRSGTFILQHNGTMSRGTQEMRITVVPDSGTGELTGLAGTMKIIIEGGKHSYEFEYTIGTL